MGVPEPLKLLQAWTIPEKMLSKSDTGEDGGRILPHALIPRIKLQGPKITRSLTTLVHRARGARFKRCVNR